MMVMALYDIVTLRVPRELAERLEDHAKDKKEYKHSRSKWADYARDVLRKAAEGEGT